MNSYLESLFSLEGKVALVTGASRGLGAAMSKALAGAGARTIGIGRSPKPRQSTSEDLAVAQMNGAVIDYCQCDIQEGEKFSALCANIFSEHGRIDILVNAAGITLPQAHGTDSIINFERTLSINLSSVHHSCKTVADYMRKIGGGSIINVTSIGSVFGFPGNPAYVASKGGLRLLTKALAFDLASDGIRVNNIAPGYMHTDMTDASYSDPIRHAERLQRMMIKRWGMPQDLAGATIFLASNASSYVTGADLFIDGGWSAKGM
jgi:NAD(P)-dependent dehydrogenase (short-subunit alcohol dehydrogenase family)